MGQKVSAQIKWKNQLHFNRQAAERYYIGPNLYERASRVEDLKAFAEIAKYLEHPLVLVGFALLLLFGVHRALIKSGVIPPLSKTSGSKVVQSLLRYGFVVAMVVALLGFALQFYRSYKATTPAIDIDKIIAPYKDQISRSKVREDEARAQIMALTQAVEALVKAREKGGDTPQVSEALSNLAEGDTKKAEDIFKDILKRRSAEGKEAYKVAAEAARHLGALLVLRDTRKALEAYQKAVELDPEEADGWIDLGYTLLRLSNYDEAERAFQRAERIGVLKHIPSVRASAITGIGHVYEWQGMLGKALEMHGKALEIHRDMSDKLGMARDNVNLGMVYQTMRDLGQAEEQYTKALKIFEALGNREGIATACQNLGTVFSQRGELAKAEKMHIKALEIDQSLGNKKRIGIDYLNLGNVYHKQGENEKANEAVRKGSELLLSLEEFQKRE